MRYLYLSLVLFSWSFSAAAQTYQNTAIARGINFRNQALTANGGGVSFVDFDRDGLDDITLATGLNHALSFYKNTGNGFTKITAPVVFTGEAQQILWVDYDNDGDLDLYISDNLGPNKLFRNNGNLNFTDVSAAAGLSSATLETYGVAWADINGDGWLDFYECNQLNFGGGRNKLYVSNGNGTFQEMGMAAGVDNSMHFSFQPIFFDYNGDNRPDLYVANDRQGPSTLYENLGNNQFADVSVATNALLNIDGMGIASGDFNRDGFPDLYITNTAAGNKLLQNSGTGVFSEVSVNMGVTLGAESWGANFFDADHDGDLDLYVSDVLSTSLRPSQRFFRNDDTVFSQNGNLPHDTIRGFSNAIGDFNNDGFYDIVCPSKFPYYLKLWQCNALPATNWVKVRLQGTVSNRDGIGSTIEVFAGTEVFRRYTQCGNSYLGQNSNTYIIGIGSQTNIDSVRIKWPSGHLDKFQNIALSQTHFFEEGSGLDTSLQVQGALQYCRGDSINVLLKGPAGYHQYVWNTGDTSAQLQVNTAGTYKLYLTTAHGFTDSTRQVVISVDSLQLSSTQWPDTNFTGRGMAAIWVNGGTPPYTISWSDSLRQQGDTARALAAGSYWAWVEDAEGCKDSLQIIVANVVSLHPSQLMEIQMYPIPLQDILHITSAQGGIISYEIYQSHGEKCGEGFLQKSAKLDLSHLASGIYILKFISDSKPAAIFKIVKE